MKIVWLGVRIVPSFLMRARPPELMALYLVNPGVEMTLELFVSDRIESAVAIQFERITDRSVRDIFVRKLEQRLDALLSDCLDWDLKEPTEAQRSYATVIAKQLGIALPSEAKMYRFHMAMFLEAHAQMARDARNHRGRGLAAETNAAAARRLVEMREAAAASAELFEEPVEEEAADDSEQLGFSGGTSTASADELASVKPTSQK